MRTLRFNDLLFDANMLSAKRDDGANLRFTRQERALLLYFIGQPGTLAVRSRLMEVLAAAGTESSERNVDFLINRLRTRLGDKARQPRFIATQYGEGYIWIAQAETAGSIDAFVIIGPAYGLSGSSGRAESILSTLTGVMDAMTGADQKIVCAPKWRAQNNSADSVAYSLDVSFHADDVALHAAFVLRHGSSRQVIGTIRAQFAGGDDTARQVDAVATRVKDAIWAHLAVPSGALAASTDAPLELRMHDAALMLARSPESWLETEAQLMRARAAQPDDPTLAIMWGLNRYARLILTSGPMTPAQWSAIEDEIETVALQSLPLVQDNPLLMLGVAKLLFFIDRGYTDLAEELADAAFAQSTAFAAAFATQAQIRMCRGDIAAALILYDKGIELSEAGSEFHIYLMVLKCTALLAANDRAALDRLCAELYAIKPITRMQFGLLLASPSQLPADLEAILGMIDETRARQMLHFLYNASARHFQAPKHRRNIMAGPSAHLIRRFGQTIVPEEIARSLGRRSRKQ